ncbi:MAG TPA: extracellular solute-binding protein [Spirochaetia bacterium]|nr:extracellular solute-binding protein [Spirochaetia bacterium]
MRKSKFLGILVLVAFIFTMTFQTTAAPKVKLTIWAVDALATTNTQAAYVQALVKNFQRQNPDIQIDWVAFGVQGSPLNDKLKIALANNQGPDIFQSWGGSFMGRFAEAGKLMDLTNELRNIKTSAAARDAMSYKGRIYGVAPFFAIAGLFVNEGKFKELGLKVPTTIDELERTAEIIKSKGYQPFACGDKDKWPLLHMYMYLVNRYGGNIFDQVVARKVRFDSEPFVKAAEKIQEWTRKGYFGNKPLAEGYGDAQLLMCTGKALMQLSGSWLCGLYTDPKQTDQTIGFYPMPILRGGKGQVTDVMGMTDVGFAATKLAAGKKDAVVRFMTYAMSVEACKAETGRVSSVPGVPPPTRLTGMASDVFAQAKTVQFWWDQDLPPTVTGPVNDTIQTFMIPDTNVRSALSKYESLLEEHLGRVR